MRQIRKCLFPVAGYGTRFLPATKAMPKEMLPILNKPLIQYGVEEALYAGMDQIVFVTGRNKRAIEDHFDINYEIEQEIKGTSKENYLKGIRELLDKCTAPVSRWPTSHPSGRSSRSAPTCSCCARSRRPRWGPTRS